MTTACPSLTVASEPYEQIEDEWSTLVRNIERPLPFDTPEWHRAWWSHFGGGRTPIYLTVREGNATAGARLVAVAPMMLDGDTLALAGDAGICDYAALPTAATDPRPLLSSIFAALEPLPWSTLHLWGLPEETPALDAAVAWGAARGYAVEPDFEAVCPRVPLATDWETQLAGLSKKDRHELKRKIRRFHETGEVRLRVLAAPDEIAEALPAFFELHRISRHDKAQFMTLAMEAFFREIALALAGRGLARLYLIEVDARPAAALLGFRSGDEALLYNSGYDPAYAAASVGIVSKAMAMQAAIADGMATFDFLRGAEPYKYDLGARDRIVRQVWMRRERGKG